MEYIKSHLFTHYEADISNSIQNAEMIARCFYPSELEEIKSRLAAESDPFAKVCLDAMNKNSDLSMKLALSMLRKADNMDYTSCLRMEVNVISNLLQRAQENFEGAVRTRLMRPIRSGMKQKVNPFNKANEKIKDIDSFFEPQPWAKNINIDTVKYALLPTRQYYHRFADVVRLWINEESTPQPEVRSHFDEEARLALRGLGVDLRDQNLSMQSAREHLYTKIAVQRRAEVERERMEQVMYDRKLNEEYYDRVRKEMRKMFDSKDFDKKIDDMIERVF